MEQGQRRSLVKEMIIKRLEEKGLSSYAFIKPSPLEASDSVQSIVVVLFPYFPGKIEGNLSLYCQGKDYHEVVPLYLDPIGQEVAAFCHEAGEDVLFHAYADTGPFNDRSLCLRAGLGIRGLNQMLIHPQYGSYFFIACMTFSLPLEEDAIKGKEETCLMCGKCVEACPGGCLGKERFDFERCRSYLTQKKGELADWEVEILKKDSLVFGCDICQRVCPMNAGVLKTPIPEFTEDRIPSLYKEDLEGLTNKTFKEKYPKRAFTWRGPKVILRNIALLEER